MCSEATSLQTVRWQMVQGQGLASTSAFGVLDAACDERIFPLVEQAVAQGRALCLYDGAPSVKYARYAPYVASLNPDEALTAEWLQHGWMGNWGVFLQSWLALDLLKRHLKHFTTARMRNGRTAWVRFYDPRVLPYWMRGLDPGHLADWFGTKAIHSCMAPRLGKLWVAQPRTGFFHTLLGTAALNHFCVKEESLS